MTARLGFPSTAPVQGHFSSIAKLHDLGFLDREGDYLRSLETAGFVLVSADRGRYLDVARPAKGVFARGVGDDAEQLLVALAEEGFEGVLRDENQGLAWYLSGGRSVSLLADAAMTA